MALVPQFLRSLADVESTMFQDIGDPKSVVPLQEWEPKKAMPPKDQGPMNHSSNYFMTFPYLTSLLPNQCFPESPPK